MHLLWNIDTAVKPWACRVLNVPESIYDDTARFAGIVDDSGKAFAAAIFTDYRPLHGTLQLSFCATSPRWATKTIIKEIFRYSFETCGVQKLWTATPHTNERALKLNYGLGFKREATLARHFGRDQHAVICRMYAEDYQRLWAKDKSGKRKHG